ncbi:N-acetylglucosamine-specific PTS transporter subunit IIBC [Aneurinibacillus thermoaerophilus]|uniref:N-acetylglucosamine-specific PTS transporter subunit IIBC n=1 Tax=Aneurinibacillus thermoaerophilus TaxID=143495 RepID=UPI002E1A370D|nr:N-acetylglucosamine-specific PTS transporter subunit IIBC [Aneurinibacillus thermoaerophilus]MED0679559.1 N-acetylglucosamine-specific PTS transporter subunit IIBC [Aneurinibacillus thermoaerophilus]MED0765014.1 N-acetylglucosamine-specific PTS transporter subunit IIBC [Aneurinibacillus thermoaerophilus]
MMNVLSALQKIGRLLMMPIAVLPAAAILLGIGAMKFQNPFMAHLAKIFSAGGGAILGNLPMLFAIGVAIGLTDGAGVAGLAATLGYFVLTNVLNVFDVIGPNGEKIVHLDMGVIGGIITGAVTAFLYRRYKDIRLPQALGFFSGSRFVPIVTALVMVVFGVVMGYVWLPVQNGIHALGMWIVSAGGIGMFLYGLLNRLLIPFGLHHILNSITWFQIGEFTNVAGDVFHGDLSRYFAGDKTAGMFMTGFFPIMMFGLPAACIAMVKEAKPEKRAFVSSVLLSAAFASFLTGVTEPIEFSFMFLAPLLFIIHAILTGLFMAFTYLSGMHLGFGFSAGFIDYVLNWHLATKPWLLIPFGVACFIVYYFVFRFFIRMFDLKTPGRDEVPTESGTTFKEEGNALEMKERAMSILPLIGGVENIRNIDACITRLRLIVGDDSLVKDEELKKLGAAGVMRLGKGNVQIVFGTESELIKEEIKSLLNQSAS